MKEVVSLEIIGLFIRLGTARSPRVMLIMAIQSTVQYRFS